jgi:hypothetical protein
MRFGSTKRQKELSRAQKRRDKDEKKEQRKKDKEDRPTTPGAEDEDPDLAGIVVGPQPPRED